MVYRVFIGAPPSADYDQPSTSYHWQTLSSESPAEDSVILPPATLEAASRRISLLYQNIIFKDSEDETAAIDSDDGPGLSPEQTTVISWPPTVLENDSHFNTTAPSFLHDPETQSGAISAVKSFIETQETQETASYNYSDASSIAHFPTFHFSLHILTALSSLTNRGKGSSKINLLLAALEVEGPDTIRIKKGVDAGKEVSILKMVLGDEEGSVCKLTAWRETAETWGGINDAPAAKRGDILLIESVTATYDSTTSTTLTASPYLKSKLQICYRTMPYAHEDKRLRPDLRLGRSDAAVRKVASVVSWFQGMAGLATAA